MSEHCIRQATTNDFDDVMKIGDVLQGVDYLWHRYHAFMNDPNVTSYIYLIGHEVVGFCSVFLLDDGLTYHVRAGRVKEGYRGQGVYVKLVTYARGQFKDVTSIQRDALVLDNFNYESMKERLLQTYTVVYRKNIQNFSLKVSENKQFQIQPHPLLCEMSTAEMTSLFSSKEFCNEFFPNGRIIVDWVPLRLISSNMKYINGQENLALVSKTEKNRVVLISIGTPIPGPVRTRYTIDIFGSDVTGLRHHIVRHITYAQSVRNTDIILQIQSPFEKNLTEAITDTFTSPSVTKAENLHTTLFHLEKEFKYE